MKTAGLLMIAFAGWAHAACITLPSDKILARDISAAVPQFQSLDPEAVLGFAPFPGTERVLSARDILAAAHRYGLIFPPGEHTPSLCVERLVRPLSVQEIRAALLAVLDPPGAESPANPQHVTLNILDFSNKAVPPGRLVFQIAALNRPPGTDPQIPVIWTGKLLYDGQHSLSVWTKVRISADREVFYAKETIPKGAVIAREQIATCLIPQFPFPEASLSYKSVLGKLARRDIPAGQRIVPEEMEDYMDVIRGETVHVRVVDGAATITLDAVAQSSGTKGETIPVHNTSSGKTFRAVIEERDRVVVPPAPVWTPPSTAGSSL
jgi:flagella basal body P-ring formation protein FlgA